MQLYILNNLCHLQILTLEDHWIWHLTIRT